MDAEYYSLERQVRQDARRKARERSTPGILSLRDEGFDVKCLTPFHFRVNGVLDLFPTSGKWHSRYPGQDRWGQSDDLKGWARAKLTELGELPVAIPRAERTLDPGTHLAPGAPNDPVAARARMLVGEYSRGGSGSKVTTCTQQECVHPKCECR